ncbi:hypothetical protein MMPV_006128 [Pyropia vietnamensis]
MGGLLPVKAGAGAGVTDGGYMPIGGSGLGRDGDGGDSDGDGGVPGGEAYRGVVAEGEEWVALSGGGEAGRALPTGDVDEGGRDGDDYDAEAESSTCHAGGGREEDDDNSATAALDAVVMAKVRRRLLPMLFTAALLCYLDRTNLSFAALEMNADLGITPGQYGTGAAVFFCTYASLGVPAALAVKRVGAHRGLPALLAGWALASGGMGAITSVRGFYVARLAVGAAEAGFFPSVIYYLTCWFRQVDMGFSYTAIMTSTAVSGVLGGPLAGAILGAVERWGGVTAGSGWRWLFVLEAAPTMVLAVVLALVLDAGPVDARFLTTPERAHLVARQAREAAARAARAAPPAGAGEGDDAGGDGGLLAALRLPWMRLLVAMWFLYSCAYYGLIFWLPLLLQASSVASAPAAVVTPTSDAAPVGLSAAAIGVASAIPYTAAAFGMLIVARSSDAACERRLHLAIPSFASAVGFAVAAVAVATTAGVGWVVVGVSIAAAGCWSLYGPYWAIPTAALSGDTAAAAFAAINSVGVVGGYVGPALVGALVGRGGATRGGEGGALGSASSTLTAAAAVAASTGYAAALGIFGGLMIVVGGLALALHPGIGSRGEGGAAGRRSCVLRDGARWEGRSKGRPVVT